MKTLQEFEQFLASSDELKTDLTALEGQRKNTKSAILIVLVIAIVFVGGVGYFFYQKSKADYQIPQTQEETITDSSNTPGAKVLEQTRRNVAKAQENVRKSNQNNNIILLILIFIGAGGAICYIYAAIVKRKVQTNPMMFGNGSGDFQFNFKDKVIRKMVAFWDPDFRYQINNHIKLEEALASGIFYPKNYKTEGSDMIRGDIDGVAFKFSDLQLWREKTFVSKGDDSYESVFFGSFFMADFQKEFKSPVYVYPNKSFLSHSISDLQHEGEKVLLEDPEFSKMFEVYSPDQIEARCILTTSMMERMKSMAKKMGNNLHFVFANQKAYVVNNNNKDRFEASWFKKVDKKEMLIRFYNELSEQLSIIPELKLNVNIWK